MKEFFRQHGLRILAVAAAVAVALSLLTYFSSTSSVLENIAGVLTYPFRAAATAVSDWAADKRQYYEDTTTLKEENAALKKEVADLRAQQRQAADCGEPASWSPDFITGGTFGFGPEQGDSADAHLPQPAWFKDFAADVEADDNGSMLHLYRKLLQLRQTVLTATGDTSADLLDMGDTVVAYSRPATEGRRFLSVTNFGDEPIALPDDAVAIANSVPLTDDGKLDSDASVWLLLG